MKLLKTSFLSAIITFIRISSGFVANKIVAIITGPSGITLIGAFVNFISIVLTFSNGAINTGVVKYTAEYEGDEDKLKSLFSTSLKISIYCSLFFGLVLIFLSPYLAPKILGNPIYINPVRVLGGTILFYSLNSLLIAILNGKKLINKYTIVNVIGSVVGLIFTAILVFYYNVSGALYAMVLSQSVVFLVTLILIVKSSWFSWDYFRRPFCIDIARKLGGYTLMSIVTALTIPISQIILRNMLIEKLDITQTGYWQGMMRISDGYLMLVTTSLSTYYLPKLSSLKTDNELKTEVLKGYKLILPMVLLGCIIIYFLRFFIIEILYTSDFFQMERLFMWQLVGDFFKIAAWILAYLMLARAMIKIFIITELLFSISFVIFGYYFVDLFKLEGVTISFALNYFIYFLVMLVVFRKILLNKTI